VFLAALKKAQDDESLVLRLFRLGGGSGETEITLPQTAEGAAETDLMEKDLARLSPEQDRLRVLVKPGEIKTLKIRWSRAG
jgi:alpha-mannosidase